MFFGGNYFLTLYDSTNGFLHIDNMCDVDFADKSKTEKTIEKQLVKLYTEKSIDIEINNADEYLVDLLNTREDYEQEIFLSGFRDAFVGTGLLIAVNVDRKVKGHKISIKAATSLSTALKHRTNILDNSDFEDASGGIADGWSAGSGATYSTVTSFLSGAGNAQRMTVASGTGYLETTQMASFRDGQRISFFGNTEADSGNAGSVYITAFLYIYASDGTTLLDTLQDTVQMNPGTSDTFSDTEVLSLSEEGCYFKLRIQMVSGAGSIDIDNFIINYGNNISYRRV